MISRSDLRRTAETILEGNPAPAVRVRLLRDVLERRVNDSELAEAREDLSNTRWVRELRREQWKDGSWGRFHSMDDAAGQRVPTTEVGVSRCLALGLDVGSPVLRSARDYIAGVLDGSRLLRDPPERNDRWSTGAELFSAATLSLIDPKHAGLDSPLRLWQEITRRTFASGTYDLQAEVEAHQDLTSATIRGSYLELHNRYTVTLLSARPRTLAKPVESGYLRWLWSRRGGMAYLGVPLGRALPKRPGPLDRRFTSLELTSRFRGWPEAATGDLRAIERARTSDGLWDLGARPSGSYGGTFFPLSGSWRVRSARRTDWTTRVLALLVRNLTRN
jgi:hypothetical protein